MKYLYAVLLWLVVASGFAQKPLTLLEAEQSLRKNNLQLLAEQFNISAAQGNVIQAKIWEQPYVSAEVNALNPEDRRVFDAGGNGQKGLAIQQLIYLGGKKKNEVAFAKSNVAIAELQFEQLVRNLKFQLSQNFYSIYFDLRKINTLDFQITKLDTLLTSYEAQVGNKNISLKDVVRLQTLVLGLKNEKNAYQKEIIEQQQELLLISGIEEPIIPSVDEAEINKFNFPKISKEELINIAITKNPEYLTALKITESQELYLKWQKSLSTPDLTAGLSYDQLGGAFQNQVNITFGIPLPLWNRNRGTIKVAEAQASQALINKDFKRQELRSKIESAWLVWQQQHNQASSIKRSVRENLEAVYQGELSNFQKRNITLLEFTDFMESYDQTTIQLNEIRKQWVLASLNLNFVTNSEVF